MKKAYLLEQMKLHFGIMARGLARTLYGTLIAGLIGTAIYGFVLINSESGYAAVFDFVAAIAVLVVALCNMYFLGNKRKGGKK
jgi:predicted lipid-binding transport protein (Tim44 family)